MNDRPTDYLVLGSGLAGLSFAALMAKSGKKVKVIEAHEFPGGYGHTFEMGKKESRYRFNAQLHYVWNCGEGDTVNLFLKKLGLEQEVTFERYDPEGFDHMRIPGYALDIPNDYEELINRLQKLFPNHRSAIRGLVEEIRRTGYELYHLPSPPTAFSILRNAWKFSRVIRYRQATLQDVFNRFDVPLEAQSLIALQWPDFLLPPNRVSFFAWVMLFDGYMRGAYYPTKHFEHVIDSLVGVIQENGGELILNHRVTQFIREGRAIKGAVAENVEGQPATFHARNTVCNFDPRQAAGMIGFDQFSPRIRQRLNYDYSPSNFMAYCAVSGIDLKDSGFGQWNLFHAEDPDLNRSFDQMYELGDYSQPSFAVTTPSLLTSYGKDCPEGHQIIEFLTVANYQRFLALKLRSPRAYREKKQEVFDSILDVMERYYIPGLRKHLAFQVTGSPTTNERYCPTPFGNSYGSNMTPENISGNRLDYRSSLSNFYFCNASSGYAGFAGTIWTGCRLYGVLSGDQVG